MYTNQCIYLDRYIQIIKQREKYTKLLPSLFTVLISVISPDLCLSSPTAHFLFRFPLSQNLSWLGVFTWWGDLNFFPEGSESSIALPVIGCDRLSLTFILGHRSTRSHPTGSPAFQPYTSLPPLFGNNPIFLWLLGSIALVSRGTSLCLLAQWPKKANIAKWQYPISINWNHYCVLAGKIPSLGAKTSTPAELKVVGMGSKESATRY